MRGTGNNKGSVLCHHWSVPLAFLALLSAFLCGCADDTSSGPSGPPGPSMTCANTNGGGDYPGCGVSKSTYSCNDPIAGWNFLNKYFPVETPEDECDNNICDCPATTTMKAWEVQQGRVYATRQDSVPSNSAGNGFGLHLVNVSEHWTTGGNSTAEVEAIFNAKLGDMDEYDAFMDYNVLFATEGLQAYKDRFVSDGVAHLAATWNSSDGELYTSIIIQVPSTQMILELVQQTMLTYSNLEMQPLSIEQRVPSSTLNLYNSYRAASSSGTINVVNSSDSSIITPLVVNRAASTEAMSKLEDFYVTGMGTTKTHDSTENSTVGEVTKKCFLWTGATVDVCFTQRPDSATTGDWKVSDFEDMLNTVHGNIVGGHPFCGMDKWEDNHYAIDSMTIDTSKIVDYINSAKPYHYCETSGSSTSVHYVWDPTGWGVQLDLPPSSYPPADCASSRRLTSPSFLSRNALADTYNPVCEVDLSVCPSA